MNVKKRKKVPVRVGHREQCDVGCERVWLRWRRPQDWHLCEWENSADTPDAVAQSVDEVERTRKKKINWNARDNEKQTTSIGRVTECKQWFACGCACTCLVLCMYWMGYILCAYVGACESVYVNTLTVPDRHVIENRAR